MPSPVSNALTTVTPTWVTPIKEEYNVNISPMREMKREYYLLSATPALQYALDFNGLTDATYKTLMQHWRSVSGTFSVFLWSTVPSYIDSGYKSSELGFPMYGRWISQPDIIPRARSWSVKMNFEKDFSYNYGFLLQEDGDYLLQEDSSEIILEDYL